MVKKHLPLAAIGAVGARLQGADAAQAAVEHNGHLVGRRKEKMGKRNVKREQTKISRSTQTIPPFKNMDGEGSLSNPQNQSLALEKTYNSVTPTLPLGGMSKI